MRSNSHSQLKFLKPRRGKRAAINPVLYTLLLGVFLYSSLAGFAEASGGLVMTDISGRAYAMVIDSLGRIVTAGDGFKLTRYNSDGSLDTTFGHGGVVTTDITRAGRYDQARALAIDSLGRIVVAGFTQAFTRSGKVSDPSAVGPFNMALARYNSDGFLDATFGNGGIVITYILPSFPNGSYADAVAIDNVDRIVVAGSSNNVFTLARYNSDGTLDNTFGGDGIVTIANIGDSDGLPKWAATVAVDSLGRIVAAGAAGTFVGYSGLHFSFALVRCNSDGTLDDSFGNGGMVTTHLSGDGPARDDSVAGIVIDSLGRIVAVGHCPWDCGNFDFELARYNSDGTLDATFGNGGLVTTHLGSPPTNNSSQALSIDSVGRIVVAGSSEDDLALARYNSDGSLDNTFGVDP